MVSITGLVSSSKYFFFSLLLCFCTLLNSFSIVKSAVIPDNTVKALREIRDTLYTVAKINADLTTNVTNGIIELDLQLIKVLDTVSKKLIFNLEQIDLDLYKLYTSTYQTERVFKEFSENFSHYAKEYLNDRVPTVNSSKQFVYDFVYGKKKDNKHLKTYNSSIFAGLLDNVEKLLHKVFSSCLNLLENLLKRIITFVFAEILNFIESFLTKLVEVIKSLLPVVDRFVSILITIGKTLLELISKIFQQIDKQYMLPEIIVIYLSLIYFFHIYISSILIIIVIFLIDFSR